MGILKVSVNIFLSADVRGWCFHALLSDSRGQKVGSQWKQFPVLTTEVNIHQETLVLPHTPRFAFPTS